MATVVDQQASGWLNVVVRARSSYSALLGKHREAGPSQPTKHTARLITETPLAGELVRERSKFRQGQLGWPIAARAHILSLFLPILYFCPPVCFSIRLLCFTNNSSTRTKDFLPSKSAFLSIKPLSRRHTHSLLCS